MDLLIILLMSLLGGVFGAGIGSAVSGTVSSAVMIGASMGWMAGGLFGYALVAFIRPVPRARKAIRPKPLVQQESRPFRSRLADFVGKDPYEVMGDQKPSGSKMSFWSAVNSLLLSPPKTAAEIRRLLLRIRRTLGR